MVEFIEGGNRISVDIVDRLGAKVGPGPLSTCIDLSFDTLLSQAGHFTARFPANDPRLLFLQLKAHFLVFSVDDLTVFCGLAESSRVEISNDGQRMMVIEGRDTLAELAETTINFEEMVLDTEAIFNAPFLVVIAYNSQMPLDMQWLGGVGLDATETAVYARFSGEPALSALMKIAEHIGESFRLRQGDGLLRTVDWLGTTTPASGVRAVQSAGDPIAAENNQRICFIQSLSEYRDASAMITNIHPYGSGLGDTRLDLEGTSRTAPVGFNYDPVNNAIASDDALSYIGKSIAKHVNFKDIRPLFNTDADIQSAKDFLFDSALEYLKRNDSIDDTLEYELSVIALPAHVNVGMTLRVVYQDDKYDVDRDLVVLGIRTAVDSDGGRLYNLTVATTNQWRLRESSAIVSQMEESELFGAHPQIDANSYWENFRELIGDDQVNHTAEMPFFLSEEIVTIRQVLFRYKVDRALTVTNSYVLEAEETDANAASPTGPSNTTSSGLTSAGNTDSGGSGTSGETAASIVNASAGTTDGTNFDNTGDSSALLTGGTNTAATAGTNTAATGDPSFDNTGDSSALLTGNTAATVDSTIDETAGNTGGVGTTTGFPDSWVDPTVHRHPVSTHTHDFTHAHTSPTHNHNMAHFHPIPHTHFMPHTHNMPHDHGMAHFHPMPHAHNISATHGHTSPAHSHSTPAHIHTTSATHSHTIAHDHASPQHVHGLPELVETQVVTRIAALNSYILADLEYAVNGGAWAGLDTGIPIAGGYTEIDITPLIQNPNGLRRPYQEFNLIEVRRKTAAGTGKSAQLRAKIGVRPTIQSIVQYS